MAMTPSTSRNVVKNVDHVHIAASWTR